MFPLRDDAENRVVHVHICPLLSLACPKCWSAENIFKAVGIKVAIGNMVFGGYHIEFNARYYARKKLRKCLRACTCIYIALGDFFLNGKVCVYLYVTLLSSMYCLNLFVQS